jgi:hypothetical protein
MSERRIQRLFFSDVPTLLHAGSASFLRWLVTLIRFTASSILYSMDSTSSSSSSKSLLLSVSGVFLTSLSRGLSIMVDVPTVVDMQTGNVVFGGIEGGMRKIRFRRRDERKY